jgi:hypothetical protein
MIEILQIIFFSLVFVLLLFLPFNIFNQTNFFQNVDIVEKTSLNLVINLNTLLLFSFFTFLNSIDSTISYFNSI